MPLEAQGKALFSSIVDEQAIRQNVPTNQRADTRALKIWNRDDRNCFDDEVVTGRMRDAERHIELRLKCGIRAYPA